MYFTIYSRNPDATYQIEQQYKTTGKLWFSVLYNLRSFSNWKQRVITRNVSSIP